MSGAVHDTYVYMYHTKVKSCLGVLKNIVHPCTTKSVALLMCSIVTVLLAEGSHVPGVNHTGKMPTPPVGPPAPPRGGRRA